MDKMNLKSLQRALDYLKIGNTPRSKHYKFFTKEEIYSSGIRDVNPKSTINLDLAPTGVAKCFVCRKAVPKDSPRAWFEDFIKKTVGEGDNKTEFDKLKVKRIICYRCVPRLLQDKYEELREQEIHLKKQIKKFKRMRRNKKAGKIIDANQILETLESEDQ